MDKKGGTVRAGPPLNLVKKGGLTRDDKVNRGGFGEWHLCRRYGLVM